MKILASMVSVFIVASSRAFHLRDVSVMNYKQGRNGKARGNLLWQSGNRKIFLDINSLGKPQIWKIFIWGDENYEKQTESGKRYYDVFFFPSKFKLQYLNMSRKQKRGWHAESRHSSSYPGIFAIRKHQLHAIRSNYQELPFLPHSNHFDDRLLCTVKQNGEPVLYKLPQRFLSFPRYQPPHLIYFPHINGSSHLEPVMQSNFHRNLDQKP